MWHIILVEDAKEQCPLEDYFESIVDLKLKAKILRDIDLLEEFGTELGLPHSKILKQRGETCMSSEQNKVVTFLEFSTNLLLVIESSY